MATKISGTIAIITTRDDGTYQGHQTTHVEDGVLFTQDLSTGAITIAPLEGKTLTWDKRAYIPEDVE